MGIPCSPAPGTEFLSAPIGKQYVVVASNPTNCQDQIIQASSYAE